MIQLNVSHALKVSNVQQHQQLLLSKQSLEVRWQVNVPSITTVHLVQKPLQSQTVQQVLMLHTTDHFPSQIA
jgi:hypothetical protein